jgi:hypothetical protein
MKKGKSYVKKGINAIISLSMGKAYENRENLKLKFNSNNNKQ